MSTEELFAALDACAERDRLLTRLAKATTDESRAQRTADKARSQVSTETVELKALEDFSPTQLWARLRGSHQTDLEREQAELQAALYQARSAEGALSEASSLVRQLRTQLAALGDVDGRRRRALDATEAELRQAGGAQAQELIDISQRHAASLAAAKEVGEAIAAADQASVRLQAAISELDSAESLADFDVFLRGGLLVDAMKYERIDRAVAALRSAGQALQRLSAELLDVDLPTIPGLDIPDLSRTFDVWFDNFFSDLEIRGRITAAAESSRRALSAVSGVRTELARRYSELVGEQEQLAQQRVAVMAR
ncbi:hypothetical protein [Propionicimonas paludicola]|uniref:hypothetical protein n=1 Tax=Propionicimonas paludicola TaxID=185243 RepID=UPI000BF5690F|nr:hypothetical protein [Propionicimonas paludicola]